MSGLAESELGRAPWVVWGKRGGGGALLVLTLIGVWFLAKELAHPTGSQLKHMAKIRIVPETPPPPPPVPEKKPEPPKEIKETKLEPPKEQPPKPQEAEPLKMEGQGSDKGLAGLAAGTVRNDYIGQKLGDGSRFAAYLGLVQQELNRALQKVDKLRSADYRVVVRVWLSSEGAITRADLVTSAGSAELDDRLRAILAQLPPLRERPPEDMPQPVKVRLTSR